MPHTLQLRFHGALQPIDPSAPAGARLSDDGPAFARIQDLRNAIDARLAAWLAAEQERVPARPSSSAEREAEQLGAVNARWFEQRVGPDNHDDWAALQTRAIDALTYDTKDLRLVTCLVESSAYAEGFGGLADALEAAAAVLSQYGDSIHPTREDDATADTLEQRPQTLAWFSDAKHGLPFVATTIPLSACPEGPQVTLRHLLMAPRRWPGWPTEESVRRTVHRTDGEKRRASSEDLKRCLAAASQLDDVLLRLEALGTGRLRERLQQCLSLVDDDFTRRAALGAVQGTPGETSNALIERLRRLQDESRTAFTARDRFLLQIAAAEACVEGELYWLAAPVLESVFNVIDEHRLAEWESPDILARIAKIADACRAAAQARGHAIPQLERLTRRTR